MRRLLHVDIPEEGGRWRLATHVDADEYRRLTEERFGLRIIMTDRDDLSTAEILAAYWKFSVSMRHFFSRVLG